MSNPTSSGFTFDPPNEILLEVFKQYVNPENRVQQGSLRTECRGFFSLFLVHSSWRAILKGCPEFLGRVIDWDADPPTKIERFLQLSGPFPITIVAGSRQARESGGRTQKELQKNYDLALDNFKRCDYFYLSVHANALKRHRFFQILGEPGSGDRLKHFTLLWETQGPSPLSTITAFPNGLKQLATFQLHGELAYDPRFFPFSQGAMTRCTTVTILGGRRPGGVVNSEFYPSVWAQRLACIPHLTHLTLCNVLIFGEDTASLANQVPVTLAQLSHLVLAGHLPTCSNLLQLLQFPSTCRLFVQCVVDSNWGWGISQFKDAWIPVVQKVPTSPGLTYKRWVVGFGTEFLLQGQDARSNILFKAIIVYQLPEPQAGTWGHHNQPRPMTDFYNLWGSALNALQKHPSSSSLFQSVEVLCLKSENIAQSGDPTSMWDSYYVPFFQSLTGVTELRLSSFSPFLWRVLSLHSHGQSLHSLPHGFLPNLHTVKLLGRGFAPSLASRGSRSMYQCVLHFLLERQDNIVLHNVDRLILVGDTNLELDAFRIERSLTLREGLGRVSCDLLVEVRDGVYLNWENEGWGWASGQAGFPFYKYLRK